MTEYEYVIYGPQADCVRCRGTGWLEATDIYPDGSYLTGRECPSCHGEGVICGERHETQADSHRRTWSGAIR